MQFIYLLRYHNLIIPRIMPNFTRFINKSLVPSSAEGVVIGKKIEPINLRKLTEINFQGDENIKEIEYSFCANNKDLRSLAKKMEEGIIYNKSNKKIYSVSDKKTTIIAINKSGKELTDEYFGDNMNLFYK